MLCKNSREEKSSTWLGAVITISSGPGGLYIPELPSQGSAYRCATSTSGTGGVTWVGWVLTASALLLRPRSPIHTIIWDRDRQENVPPLPPLTPKESPTSHTPRGVPSESSHPARHPQWSRHFPKTAPTSTEPAQKRQGASAPRRIRPRAPARAFRRLPKPAGSAALRDADTISHRLRLCPAFFAINTPWTLNPLGISLPYRSDLQSPRLWSFSEMSPRKRVIFTFWPPILLCPYLPVSCNTSHPTLPYFSLLLASYPVIP